PHGARLEPLDLEAAADRGLGEHAHELAGPEAVDGFLERAPPRRPVDGDVLELAHDRARHRVVEHLGLGHAAAARPMPARLQPGVAEVEGAGVLDPYARPPDRRPMPSPAPCSLRSLRLDRGAGDAAVPRVKRPHAAPASGPGWGRSATA